VKLIAQLHYAAEPDDAFAMLTNTDFQSHKCVENGSISYSVDIAEHHNGGATIKTLRVMPTDKAPDYVRAIIGQSLTVDEVDEWDPPTADGSRAGTIHVAIRGAPVKVTGRIYMRREAGGTVNGIDAEVKASVPFLGGKIEKAVEPVLQAALRVEQREGKAWIARGMRPADAAAEDAEA